MIDVLDNNSLRILNLITDYTEYDVKTAIY